MAAAIRMKSGRIVRGNRILSNSAAMKYLTEWHFYRQARILSDLCKIDFVLIFFVTFVEGNSL